VNFVNLCKAAILLDFDFPHDVAFLRHAIGKKRVRIKRYKITSCLFLGVPVFLQSSNNLRTEKVRSRFPGYLTCHQPVGL
jgi:hypothetical protein